MEKEIIDAVPEKEMDEKNISEEDINSTENKKDDVLDGLKETFDKAVGFVGEAAKDAGIFVGDAAKGVGEFVDGATKGVGEFVDGAMKDVGGFVEGAAKGVGEFAGVQLNAAAEMLNKVGKDFGERVRQQRIDKYRPVFSEDVESAFRFPKMINVVEYDKRMNISECKNAVGFMEKINNEEVLGVYKNEIDRFHVTFYPEKTEYLYYVHPLDKTMYIEISEYFKYLKEARVAELESIAQALGAKHFKVSIMEESSSESIKKGKGDAKLGAGKDKADAKVEYEDKEKKYEFLGVAAESSFPGKNPVRPELRFWKNNIAIKNLVEQRLSPDNPLYSKSYKLDYNTSTGIKEVEAAKIDGVLKKLKFNGAGSISEEVKKESKRRFEFLIEF